MGWWSAINFYCTLIAGLAWRDGKFDLGSCLSSIPKSNPQNDSAKGIHNLYTVKALTMLHVLAQDGPAPGYPGAAND